MAEFHRAEEFKKSGKKLFDIQPESSRKQLDISLIPNNVDKKFRRILEFDPTDIYNRINELGLLNPFLRKSSVGMDHLFPNQDGKCACGCGKELTGRRKRWASKECSEFAIRVFWIIGGYTATLRLLRSAYIGGYKCEVCNESEIYKSVELDHVFPVKFGGGGGWLSNYQFKCKKCHREKTNSDFGYKSKTKENDRTQEI